jgi:hypothetical protein
MTTTNPPTNIPLPAGAVRVCPWDDVDHGDPHRYWVGRRANGCAAKIEA